MKRQLRVTLVRHGETSLNVQGVLQGHTDAHLNEVGIGQAEALGKHIAGEQFTRAIASDLSRARHTAELILKHSKCPPALPLTTDARLRERNYGSAEGQTVAQYFEEVKKTGKHVEEFTPAGGESVPQLFERIEHFFKELCELADKKDNNPDDDESSENILIVTHGGFLKAFMTYLHRSGDNFVLENFEVSKALRIPPNTGVTKLHIHPLTSSSSSSAANGGGNGKEGNNEGEGKRVRVIKFHTLNDATHLDNEQK